MMSRLVPGDIVNAEIHDPALWDKPQNPCSVVGQLRDLQIGIVLATNDERGNYVLVLAPNNIGWIYFGCVTKL